ncbi:MULTISPECIES: methyl-accepting chemotaxis protein [Halorussus]|uniref:methyl-accepting chemotaxis protein n=1 Tax=Halorussus TaxID=1070314 RepID=UPI000E2125B5|nr:MULTISPECIES: methyl-accepting chemotaxis protein [Halorussus]NHN57526.1 HAMP domain-containing protein [Halorussus sp. JP-T4]
MKIRTNLIVVFLIISLVPVAAVGMAGLQNMESVGSYAQDKSTEHMERQVTGELNNSVAARQEEFQNLLNVRRIDARSLADSRPVQNYEAASAGQMELFREQSERRVGHTALQMHDTIETTTRTVLEERYDGRSWNELSATEREQVERRVERILVGTAGNGTESDGTVSEMFQPGYIGDTGYAYITDRDSNIVSHHSLADGFNLKEDASLTVFDEIESNVESEAAIRNGSDWGIATYEWEDTTQEGNPLEQKFIAYTYYERFDWVLAPSVYYYELQTAAVANAREGINESFRSYMKNRAITVDGVDRPAYDEIILTDDSGQGVLHASRTDGEQVVTESVEGTSYADTEWYRATDTLERGWVHVSDVREVDGALRMYVSTPVYHDGAYAGTVALRFNFSILSRLTNDVTVGDSGHLSVVDGDGRILSHPNRSLVDAEANIANEATWGSLAGIARDRILAGKSGLDTYARTEGGAEHRYYVGYAPLRFGDQRFALLATVPEQDVTGPAAALGSEVSERTTSARNLVLGLVGLVVVVVVGLGYKLAQYFSRPIEQVRDRATALAEGRFDEEVDVSSPNDEINELADAFAEMQANLRRQVAELRSVSENLGEGNLDRDVDTDLPGEFGAIMTDIDDGMARLRTGFGEIRQTSQQIKRGELDQDVDTDLPGEYGAVLADLESGVEQLGASFDQIRDASEQLREGNLDQDVETDLPGQYGAVMADLDAGLSEVERSLAEVKGLADRFAEVSDETATSAEEIEAASQATAESVEEIAHGAERQTEQLQEAASEMNDLSATVEEIASSADGVVQTANEAAEMADRGRDRAGDAIEEIGAIESEADTAVEQVEDLGDRIEAINEIVGLITDIAEQTNLLALNASIEAARAGEAGEGFAVVADEIKTLASEAGDATDEVEELIDDIQDHVGDTVGDMQSMQERVETGSETIEGAIEQFDDIADVIEDAEHGVEEISAATEDQAVSTEEVVSMVDEVSSVSEETAAEASSVSSATEEQTAAINDVSRNVQEVSESARNLQSLVDQFEVGDYDDEVGTGFDATEFEPKPAATDGGAADATDPDA